MEDRARPPIGGRLIRVLLALALAVGLVPAGAFGGMRLAWADGGCQVRLVGHNWTYDAYVDGEQVAAGASPGSGNEAYVSAPAGAALRVVMRIDEGFEVGTLEVYENAARITRAADEDYAWDIVLSAEGDVPSIWLQAYGLWTCAGASAPGGHGSATVAGDGIIRGDIPVTLTPDAGYAPSLVEVSEDGGATWEALDAPVENADGTWSTSVEALRRYTRTDFLVRAAFEPAEVIEVADEAGLRAIAARVNGGDDMAGKTVALTADIELASDWEPIGGSGHPFSGTFDGRGHEISGLAFAEGTGADYGYVGLFGRIESGAVRDLAVAGSASPACDEGASGPYAAGGICAVAAGASFAGCSSSVDVAPAGCYAAGGICGYAQGGCRFSGCTATGDVGAAQCAGGICGNAWAGDAAGASSFEACGAYGKVSSRRAAGGICGAASGASFSSCATKGKVAGMRQAGGICGSMAAAGGQPCAFADCYCTGRISCPDNGAAKRDAEAVAAGIAACDNTATALAASFKRCYFTGTIEREGAFADTATCTGGIAPARLLSGSDYAGWTEVDASANWEMEGCFGPSDIASLPGGALRASDLNGDGGTAWRDDADVAEGSPLLAWEPEDATNVKPKVAATGLTLSADALGFEEGDAPVTLTATVEPADATDAVTWASSDESVATVSAKGVVAPIGAGTCTVTATAGDVSATCAVTVSAFSGTLVAAGAGDLAITCGGAYKLSYGYSGTVTVATSEAVEVKGAGTGRDAALGNVYFDCTGQQTALTLRDIYISNAGNKNLADFAGAGSGSTLSIEGTVILDYAESAYAGGHDALIHVPQGCSLTLAGAGTLYLYKSSAGAGIGGDASELNGDITFGMGDATGNLFAKGTKQGALIGAGADSASAEGEPGAISFASGTYNLISNSRGAAIGGSAGSAGASAGTQVSVSGNASVNVNVDYSGAAVGGGGYAQGNDASGGTLTVTGGSFRTYVDRNAATNVAGAYWKGLALAEGVNDAAVTAERVNASGEDVYLCAIDTTGIAADADGSYVVTVDGEAYYTGKLHAWAFLREATDRALPGGGVAESGISYTPDNWVAGSDPCLYAYLTGEDHVIEVNGVRLAATWDASALGTAAECTGGCFALAEAPAYAEHTVGDVNDSGAISIVDAQIALDMANGLWDAAGDAAGTFGLLLEALADAGTAWDLATLIHAADANADGAVDALDARAIQVRVHTGAFA